MADLHSDDIRGADGNGTPEGDFFNDSTPQYLLDDKQYISLYLRCRYDRRDGFKAGLPECDQQSIEQELTRITKLRRIFARADRNLPEIDKLKELKKAWKLNAIKNVPGNLKKNNEEMEELRGKENGWIKTLEAIQNEPTIHAELTELKEQNKIAIKRVKNKDRILEKVKNWAPTDDEIEKMIEVPNDPGYGFNVSKIVLRKSKAQASSFDQYEMKRYSVSDVLSDEPSPDRGPWKTEATENITYFHLPANNMKWIETAIRRHYNEKEGDEPQTLKILSRELWKGQQHGSASDPIHARHMRSHCKCVSRDPEVDTVVSEKGGNNNIVLFMPYLHWETDRKRAQMANIVKQLTSEHQRNQTSHHIRDTGKLSDLLEEHKKTFGIFHETKAKETAYPDQRNSRKSFNELFPNATPCGLFLMQAAKVYEAMELEPDFNLVHKDLHEKLPLHPRRTLDQSYYFKLENTESRDRDQVVYRRTKEGRKIHGTTRIVMVDQLWMYILDENTIITSFPRRLGHNKPDSSGVHRCIRSRLERLHPGQVNSVYDLALLIINECSMVFFDRTVPIDGRPEVLDLFADAIGYVSEMKTTAFELFWRHLQILSRQRLKINPEKARIYLNINPEGILLREAHDIVEELKMMSHICIQQLQVTQAFAKALETINGRVEPMQEITGLLGLMLRELQRKNSSNLHGDVTDNTSQTDIMSTNHRKSMIKHSINRSLDLVGTISNHHNELHHLEDSAREIADQLRDLLTLKQQQASIIEATAALDRADETVNQGRSIMVFTIISIIFLPLSFMSSIFGMNAKEFTGPSNAEMGIREQFNYMFPISIALTLFFLYLALISPSPKLIRFPSIIYFLCTFTLASYYGLTGKTKKWEELFIFMNLGPAMKKLPKKSRDKVRGAYEWCVKWKTKYLRGKSPEDSHSMQQIVTGDEGGGQVETHELGWHSNGSRHDGSTNGDHIVDIQ